MYFLLIYAQNQESYSLMMLTNDSTDLSVILSCENKEPDKIQMLDFHHLRTTGDLV